MRSDPRCRSGDQPLLLALTLCAERPLWRHRDGLAEPPHSLLEISYDGDGIHYPRSRARAGEEALAEYLESAQAIFTEAAASHPPAEHIEIGAGFEALRWFPVPEELA